MKTYPAMKILVIYEPHVNHAGIRPYIEELRKAEMKVILKVRKDHDIQEQLDQYGVTEFKEELDWFDWFNASVVAGTYSSMLWEAAERLKPVVVFKVRNLKFWKPELSHYPEFATVIRSPSKAVEGILKAYRKSDDPEQELVKIAKPMWR